MFAHRSNDRLSDPNPLLENIAPEILEDWNILGDVTPPCVTFRPLLMFKKAWR